MVRSFPTKTGGYDPEKTTGRPRYKQHAANVRTVEHEHDTLMRQLAGDLQENALVKTRGTRVLYLDVTSMSDFPAMHPQMHTTRELVGGAYTLHTKRLLDCRHVCQTCGVLRSWTSLLASLLLEVAP